MTMKLAYAALAVTALTGSAALAQQANDTSQPPPAQSGGQFIEKQSVNEWRAPKLIGVAVYGADNQKVGKIKDILMSHDGKADTIVIGVGGFLGIGSKDVALPFQAVQWRTEGRTLPSEPPAPTSAPLTSAGGQQPAQPPPKKTDPAATEASQGYPDKAMIAMTEAELKSAPEFQYAPSPLSEASEAPTQRQEPQPSKP
jgi:hypothetical protein